MGGWGCGSEQAPLTLHSRLQRQLYDFIQDMFGATHNLSRAIYASHVHDFVIDTTMIGLSWNLATGQQNDKGSTQYYNVGYI